MARKFVRVKDKETGNHFTVPDNSRLLKREGDRFEVVDLPALDKSGRPRGPKYPPQKAAGPATEANTPEAKKEAKTS